MPVLDRVLEHRPDLFIYLGDNIYGDSTDMDVLRAKYKTLGERSEFRRLKNSTALIATWDDHDYGMNDAGREYPKKVESKEIFLDFWKEPEGTERRMTEGIYTSYEFEEGGQKLQIILLDTRTFRDPLSKNKNNGQYVPHKERGSTLLGEVQWSWLKSQLLRTSDLRIIGTSIQFGHEYNSQESWTNFLFEQQRMVDLIQETKANGVIFISGDVHWGEISRRFVKGGYDLYDVTSSGLNRDWHAVSPNKYRVGNPVREHNFGLIEIDWSNQYPQVGLSLYDVNGVLREKVEINGANLWLMDQ